jgi:hypothetical protein
LNNPLLFRKPSSLDKLHHKRGKWHSLIDLNNTWHGDRRLKKLDVEGTRNTLHHDAFCPRMSRRLDLCPSCMEQLNTLL